MSDGESFLARWSRLKRENAAAPATSDPPLSGPPAAPAVPAVPSVVDVASLPPIESLGPGSDISIFLSEGVPPELTQAALRSAWRADPTIREFVEISDNQWDFNDPEAMPGFGALGVAEQARNLVARAMGILDDDAGTLPSATPSAGAPASPEPDAGAPPDQVVTGELQDSRVIDPVWRAGATSPQQIEQASPERPEKPSSPDAPAPSRRLHGSALPK